MQTQLQPEGSQIRSSFCRRIRRPHRRREHWGPKRWGNEGDSENNEGEEERSKRTNSNGKEREEKRERLWGRTLEERKRRLKANKAQVTHPASLRHRPFPVWPRTGGDTRYAYREKDRDGHTTNHTDRSLLIGFRYTSYHTGRSEPQPLSICFLQSDRHPVAADPRSGLTRMTQLEYTGDLGGFLGLWRYKP